MARIDFEERISTTFTRRDGIASDMIEAIVPGQRSIWFLSRNHGASRLVGERFETFSRINGLPSDAIYSLYEETPEVIWFGTDRGLARWSSGAVEVIDAQRGLIGQYVLGIIPHHRTSRTAIQERTDALWVITDRMLHRITDGILERFGSSPILPSDDASINQVFHVWGTPRVWLATTRGAVELDLSKVRRVDGPPPVVITEVVADTVRILHQRNVGTRMYDEQPRVELPHYLDDLNIRFAAQSYSHEPSVRYRYRLVGTEETWSTPTTETTVRYRQLSPGTYRFEVLAINPDGIVSSQPAVFPFVVLAPFWQKAWFFALMGGVLVSLIGGVLWYVQTQRYRSRIARLEREEAIVREREQTRLKIARDLHDDIASTLGSIALYTESLRRSLRHTSREKKQLLEKISRMSSEAVDAMGDIIWSVAPRHDTLRELMERMRQVAVETCTISRLEYDIRVPSVQDDMPLQDSVRRNLYLIFKEALNNVLRHAQATKLTVDVRLNGEKLMMTIEDNGRGLAPGSSDRSRSSTGHGLQNMRKRAEEIGAKLTLESPNGGGTRLRLEVMLTPEAPGE